MSNTNGDRAPRREKISVRVDGDVLAVLAREAARERRSASNMLNAILARWAETHTTEAAA